MKNKLENMIKQMCDHRDCDRIEHRIEHRLDHPHTDRRTCKRTNSNRCMNTHLTNSSNKFTCDHTVNPSNTLNHPSIIFSYRRSSTMRQSSISSFQLTFFILSLSFTLIAAQSVVTFEKLTNRDYSGFTYYTIRNVSLYECLGKFHLI